MDGDTSAVDDERGLSRRAVAGVWVVVVAFALVTWARSAQVAIPLRDPGGKLVTQRFVTSIVLVVALALAQALWTAVRRHRSLRALAAVPRVLRAQWPWQRVWPVAMALVAYHVVYICYRNMKSWVAFQENRDHDLMALDRALFGGHTPAALLHDLFGQHAAAVAFAQIYDSFPKLVSLSVAASLVWVRPVRRAVLFTASMIWVWILGTATYYLVPSLGPFATSPQYFAGLTRTSVTRSQDSYLASRDALLADPATSHAVASISAFASLHCGVTCVIAVMVYRYGYRRLAAVLAVYLAAIMVSTIYVGMHFVVDDVAGILIALASVYLGQLTIGRSISPRPPPAVAVAEPSSGEPVGSPA